MYKRQFECTAYDRGLYLKKNETYLAVRNQTPEAVTAQICREFGIKPGSLAATGIRLSRNFLGVSLYRGGEIHIRHPAGS